MNTDTPTLTPDATADGEGSKAPMTWSELTEQATHDTERARLREVPPILRDRYATALADEAREAAADPNQRQYRTQFASWARELVAAFPGSAVDSVRFRDYLGAPDKYPGGMDGLRADSHHSLAMTNVERALQDEERALEIAKQALSAAQQYATRHARALCVACKAATAVPADVRRRTTGLGTLDTLDICDSCAERAVKEHTQWRALPVKRPEW
jgi:hypothetical protein